MTKARQVVSPVRVDDGDCIRKLLVGLVMIDNDRVESKFVSFRERLKACHAAIDCDQQPYTALGERTDRVNIRPITFKDAIGDVDDRIQTAEPYITAEQGDAGRTVDV